MSWDGSVCSENGAQLEVSQSQGFFGVMMFGAWDFRWTDIVERIKVYMGIGWGIP